MNVYDSQKIMDLLGSHGYRAVDDVSDAHVIVVNTCNIREKASEKLYSELGRIRSRGNRAIVVVAGCVAQAEGDEVFRRAPNVDIVVGPQSIQNLPAMLEQVESNRAKKIDIEFYNVDKFSFLPDGHSESSVVAYLAIQEGCDKFCHFCCVPYTRGSEYSRPVNDVVREAELLVSRGAKELLLLGQNVNAYRGWDDDKVVSLGYLLDKLSNIEGLLRLRYTSSHPLDMHDELYAAHANNSKVMPFLHLPVQSGSNRILQLMNRRHDVNRYLDAIDRIRNISPDIQISSDFIVGYPGETDRDFEDTLDLVRKVKYAQAFSFKYSARPGTPAAKRELDEGVPETLKDARLAALQALLNEQQHDINMSMSGRHVSVLFERADKSSGQIVGRTPYAQIVYADGSSDLVGREVDVEITKSLGHSLVGKCVDYICEARYEV